MTAGHLKNSTYKASMLTLVGYVFSGLCRLLGHTQFNLGQVMARGRDSLNLNLIGENGEKLEVRFPVLPSPFARVEVIVPVLTVNHKRMSCAPVFG